MLLIGNRLIGMPVMGLQTGTQLAVTKTPIIDPSNLKIIAYEIEGPMLSENPSFIRIADVREISNVGMIIDSNDEFIGIDDVVKIKEVYELGFRLIGLGVTDDLKDKLGKVESYNIDSDSFTIQQLNVKQGFMKSLSEAGLLIHRSQIIEINNHDIVVKSAAKKLAPMVKPGQMTHMNPFRSTPTNVNNKEL
ncbi:MAG: hypothetical protein WCP11_02230 [Candidatus Saccharibacteria bacterium]